jgi:hypothetical protein
MGMDLEVEGLGQAADPSDCLGELLASTEVLGCLELLDPYADTEFRQPQVAALAKELTATAARATSEALRRTRQHQLVKASEAGWQPSVIEEFRRRASISDDELLKRLTQIRQHVDAVVSLLNSAAERNLPARFIGD